MSTATPLRFAVFGVGAVGGFFGGRLAHGGQDVTFIARGETVKALADRGLRVDSIDGNFVVDPVHVTADPHTLGKVDVVILGVKAWQVPTILPDLRPLLHDQTAVLPLQNGVEAPEQIGSALGEQHPLVGLCRIISARIGPGHIRQTGAEPYVAVGEIDGHHSKRVERILAAFDTVGVTAERPADIIAALWEKFLFITAVSGLGAVTRVSIGELRALRQTRALLADSMREVMTLARARGIELPPDTVARTMDFIDALPESGTASMQRDIMAAVPSELESQNGAVARMAAAAGVEAPINTLIHTLLLPLERQARKNVAVAGKPA